MTPQETATLFVPLLGAEHVVTGAKLSQRHPGYCPDAFGGGVLLKPGSTAEVAGICALVAENGLSVVPQGGLTGLVQGAGTCAGQVALSLERMNRVLSVDPDQAVMVLEAGATLQQAIDAAAEHRLMPGIDLPSRGSCTLGGIAATNAGGIQAIRYGMARENILGLEAVLADGTVLDLCNTLLKNNAGYDLKQLFIGSEGTLGVITQVVLRLHSAPVRVQTALVACDTAEDLITVLGRARASFGGSLLCFEAMWPSYFERMSALLDVQLCDPGQGAYGIIETGAWGDGDTAEDTLAPFLAQQFENGLIGDGILASSERQRRAIWQVREESDLLETATGPCLSYDVGLRLRDIPTYANQVCDQLEAQLPGSACFVFGHIGDGNLHIMAGPAADAHDREKADAAVYGVLAEFAGTTVSAEHGIGVEKRSHLGDTRSPAVIAAMKTVKAVLDPRGSLNPSKIFEL